MLWISFGRWSSASGALFIRQRVYWNGWKWTPFVRVFWRYCHFPNVPAHAGAVATGVEPIVGNSVTEE